MPRPTAGVLWYARHEARRAERVFRRSAAHVAPDDSPGRWPGLHSNDQRERQIPHHEERQSSQAQRKIQQQEDSGKGRHGHNSGFSRRFHPVQLGDQRRKIARRAILIASGPIRPRHQKAPVRANHVRHPVQAVHVSDGRLRVPPDSPASYDSLRGRGSCVLSRRKRAAVSVSSKTGITRRSFCRLAARLLMRILVR